MNTWQTCLCSWWLLLHPWTLCSKQDQCVFCMHAQFHSYILHSCRKSIFYTIYGTWRLLTFVKGNQYMHFGKALIIYYLCAKFEVSVLSSLWEKLVWVCMLTTFCLPCHLWLPTKMHKYYALNMTNASSIIRKPNSVHTVTIVAWKKCTFCNKNARQINDELAQRYWWLFLDLQTLCNKQDQCISYACPVSFIHSP